MKKVVQDLTMDDILKEVGEIEPTGDGHDETVEFLYDTLTLINDELNPSILQVKHVNDIKEKTRSLYEDVILAEKPFDLVDTYNAATDLLQAIREYKMDTAEFMFVQCTKPQKEV